MDLFFLTLSLLDGHVTSVSLEGGLEYARRVDWKYKDLKISFLAAR